MIRGAQACSVLVSSPSVCEGMLSLNVWSESVIRVFANSLVCVIFVMLMLLASRSDRLRRARRAHDFVSLLLGSYVVIEVLGMNFCK